MKNKFLKNLKKSICFYNKEIKKKHFIIFMIMLILLLVSFSFYSDGEEIINQDVSRIYVVKETLLTSILLVTAGVVPYVFIPVIGFLIPIIMGFGLIQFTGFSFIIMIIIQIIKIIIYALVVSIGIHICSLSTKRYRYNSSQNITFNSMKRDLYKILKKDKKVEEVDKKILDRNNKLEKLNVKIPYLNIIYLSLIATILLVMITLITGV